MANILKLSAEEAKEILSEDMENTEIVSDKITDTSRWLIHYELIFRYTDGKYYRTYYSVGATEQQDEGPWEYEKEVECYEVRKVEKMGYVWEKVE